MRTLTLPLGSAPAGARPPWRSVSRSMYSDERIALWTRRRGLCLPHCASHAYVLRVANRKVCVLRVALHMRERGRVPVGRGTVAKGGAVMLDGRRASVDGVCLLLADGRFCQEHTRFFRPGRKNSALTLVQARFGGSPEFGGAGCRDHGLEPSTRGRGRAGKRPVRLSPSLQSESVYSSHRM